MIKQGKGHILIIELIIKCLHVGSGIPALPLDSLGTAHTSHHMWRSWRESVPVLLSPTGSPPE